MRFMRYTFVEVFQFGAKLFSIYIYICYIVLFTTIYIAVCVLKGETIITKLKLS